jgi:hypothetical protein
LIAGAAIGASVARRNSNDAPPEEYEAAPPPPAAPATEVDQLQQLAQLHASGALTDEEFAAEKAKILGG